MPLFPDLADCDIRFMSFRFHLAGGLEFIESFWRERGLESDRERLVFGEYVRQKVTHTVFIRWSRAHETCANVEFGLHVGKASIIYPDRGKSHRLLGQREFRSFFDVVRTMDVPSGVTSRFGYAFELPGFNYRPVPSVRFTRLSLEFLDKDGRAVIEADHILYRDEWLLVLAPAGRVSFLPEPVTDKFFAAPYEKACVLGKTIGRRES